MTYEELIKLIELENKELMDLLGRHGKKIDGWYVNRLSEIRTTIKSIRKHLQLLSRRTVRGAEQYDEVI